MKESSYVLEYLLNNFVLLVHSFIPVKSVHFNNIIFLLWLKVHN